MQGGKKWILPKDINANQFSGDSHWLEIWTNHLCPSMGPKDRMEGAWLWTRVTLGMTPVPVLKKRKPAAGMEEAEHEQPSCW